ncbi:MAG TPA: AAA family ATPase [Candidatus Dependentiae bacterium]|nr:AAA family ATPase [Candidatus Dependentiae bacterium]
MGKRLISSFYRLFLFSIVSFFSLPGNDQIDPKRLAREFGDALGKSLVTGIEKAAAQSSGRIAHGISKETVDGIMRGIADTFGPDGQGSRVTRNFWRNMGRDFGSGGEADNALTTTADSLRRFTSGAGEGFVDVTNRLGHTVVRNYKSYLKWSLIGAFASAVIWIGSRAVWNWIERRLKKPRVIINSSKKGLWKRFKNWLHPRPEPVMIFQKDLENRLSGLVKATKIINKKIKLGITNVKYRNVLLYGVPGTGKTMFARKLARLSGLEFVELTGSSFFQENAGIGAIDELFSWAKKSKKGLCIFIDEADSLLSKREHMKPDSEAYRIVNHFLNYLGERSDRFMIIMATNHPQLDKAMERRIDDAIEMPLPQLTERKRTLCLYRDEILLDKKQNSKAFIGSVNSYLSDEVIKIIAQKTADFSYGDLHGVINSIKTDADIAPDGLLTEKIIEQVITNYLSKKQIFTIIQAIPIV